jgi:hypothetical protein
MLKETALKSRVLLILLTAMGLLLLIFSNLVSAQIAESDPITKSTDLPGTLRIEVSSNNSVIFSLNDLKAMPKTIVNAELLCFGRPIKNGAWGGVQLGLLLKEPGVVDSQESLRFYASDGYSIYVSNSYLTQGDVIIAYELDEADLDETLRLVIPEANGESWISMITLISMDTTAYVNSPNPQAAYVVGPFKNIQTPPPSQQPKPSVIPEPKSQPTTQSTVSSPTNQPVQQQNSPDSALEIKYGYQILSGIIILAGLTTGYLFFKRRKRQI